MNTISTALFHRRSHICGSSEFPILIIERSEHTCLKAFKYFIYTQSFTLSTEVGRY